MPRCDIGSMLWNIDCFLVGRRLRSARYCGNGLVGRMLHMIEDRMLCMIEGRMLRMIEGRILRMVMGRMLSML